MNRVRKILVLLIFTSISLTAQETLKFERVIETDSVGKELIFVSVNDWFATTYNSANDVIQMADKDAGVIVGNGSMSFNYKGMSYVCYEGYLKYTIKVYIKDNRFKVVLTNFNHTVKPGNAASCALGVLTTAEVYATKGMSKKYHNKVWDGLKLKAETYSEGIFNSLAEKTKDIKNDNGGGDW
ncbi:DUF4468 domain-containing protein [Lutimonas halocynthiae]|uniref:DUF4468 domain-containing protein n=1 Tax=Lutimonas halocynthiae TaxID=1446477 RepID=UPI0025B437BC|nr:DUF4468 domain-containing protein [Lutimonas halocynthiae]MDN3642922.1 DUF4468 domain-containing protein [Lutimonas halocynthiae]